jgi:hypothetical protein
MNIINLDGFGRKRVLIYLKTGETVFGEIVEAFAKEVLVDTKNGSCKKINQADIEKIEAKIDFLHPKRVYERNGGSKGVLTAKIEELMKSSNEYELTTRKHRWIKNGHVGKVKISASEVEKKFAEITTPQKLLTLCAFAYYKNTETNEEFFVIGRADGKITVTNKNLEII